MKPRISNQRNLAWTIIDLVVVIAVIVVLAYILLPVLAASKSRGQRITCVNNLKQLTLALRVWENDNVGLVPTLDTSTNLDGLELNSGQMAWVSAMGLSNIMSSAKILHCPADTEPPPTNSFKFKMSYFLNVDARKSYPQMLLSGDDNLQIGFPPFGQRRPMNSLGVPGDADFPLKSGVWELPSNIPITWTTLRHGYYVGNVSFADGSVAELSTSGFQQTLQLSAQGTPTTTNRLAIP